jgi:folate-binding protein YgfZ
MQKSSIMTETVIAQTTPANHSADEDLSVTAPATPLAALLIQQEARPELMAYRGAQTQQKFDAPEKETAALAFGVAVHDLGWMRRVEVRGEDSFRWLSGMVTNTLKDLAANGGAWNFVLNAQGRIQGDLHVWREGDDLSLEIAADQYDRLLSHLDRFIIMDDVELKPTSAVAEGQLSGETALGLTGPLAADLLARLGLTAPPEQLTSARAAWNGLDLRVMRAYGALAPHYELWAQAAQVPALWRALIEAGAVPVGAASLEAFRIAEGVPAYGIDMAERDLPQETSQMRALSFNKGCYVGQELVERIRSHGNVQRHLRQLELFGPAPAAGAELTMEDGGQAGLMTSAAELPLPTGKRCFALGMIRGESEARDLALKYIAGTAAGSARILIAPPELEAS